MLGEKIILRFSYLKNICHCLHIHCGHVDISFAGTNTLQYTTVSKHQLDKKPHTI